MNHGVTVSEQATALKSMVVGDSVLPLIVGTAPVNMMKQPLVNEVVLCLNYKEAVANFSSIDGEHNFTILHAIDILYKRYGIEKCVFVNVLDPKKHKKTQSELTIRPKNKKVETSHIGVLLETIVVKAKGNPLTIKTDYTVSFNDKGNAVITAVSDKIKDTEDITIQYDYLDTTMVTANDIIGGVDSTTNKNKGIECINDVFPKYNVITTILACPGFSHLKGVAPVMATKCKNINSLFNAVAIADIKDETIKKYSDTAKYKTDNSLNDPALFLCFPEVTYAGKNEWLSTHLIGVMGNVDSASSGMPHKSPSNNSCKIDGLVNNDVEMLLDLNSANYLNENGIVTALNFIGGFKIWGNRTSCYPANTDVKDCMIPVRRIFYFISNSLITNFWQNVDMPINKRNIENILSNVQFWLDSLKSQEVLNGAKITFPDDLNPDSEIINGKIKFKIEMASPVPAESIEFILEYDASLLNI